MVSRLVLAVMGVWALCATAIGFASLAPRFGMGPLPWLAAGSDCILPCWRGITPGATPIGEAARLLGAMPDLDMQPVYQDGAYEHHPFGFRGIAVEQREGDVSALLLGGDRSVSAITFGGSEVRLGDLIARFGSPDSTRVHVSGITYATDFAYARWALDASMNYNGGYDDHQHPCRNNRLGTTVKLTLSRSTVSAHWNEIYRWRGFNAVFDELCAA